MPDIIAKTSVSEPFRVLAVGAGNGKPYDEELLSMLCTSQKHVVYTVVEPSETAVKEFQDLVRNKYSSIEFRWFCMTWQDFQDEEWKKKDTSKYNIIHFVHSVYYISSSVEELRERMNRCYTEMLYAGGAIIISAASRKGKCYYMSHNPDSISKFLGDFNMILKIATEQGWRADADELQFQFDLSKCFVEDSVEGNLLLDFITHVKDFRLTASREMFEYMMKKLDEQTHGVEKIVYPCIFDVTTIWKED